jgi:hypothetical protein
MNERDKTLRFARKKAFDRQREIRDEAYAVIDRELKRADVRLAVRAALAKRVEVSEFVKWLRTAGPPKNVAHLRDWLVSNGAGAFAGYNSYIAGVAMRVAQALIDSGLQDQIDSSASELTKAIDQWLKTFPAQRGATR